MVSYSVAWSSLQIVSKSHDHSYCKPMGEFVHPLILHVLPLLLNQFISEKIKTLMLFLTFVTKLIHYITVL